MTKLPAILLTFIASLLSSTGYPIYAEMTKEGSLAVTEDDANSPPSSRAPLVARQLPWPAEGPLNIYVGTNLGESVLGNVKAVLLPDGSQATFVQYPGEYDHLHVWIGPPFVQGLVPLPDSLTIEYLDGTSETITVIPWSPQ